MRTTVSLAGSGGPKNALSGFLRGSREPDPTNSLKLNAGRLAAVVGVGLVLLYGMFASTGYLWLHYVLKNDRVGFTEVALFRWHRVRKAMAADQFAAAKTAWDAGNFQAAYLAYISGVRNDPENVEGRLAAASFIGAAGAANLEISVLEEGLRRFPDNRQLIERTFTLLTSSGRDRRALELLRRQYAGRRTGPNETLLRTYETLATLNADGVNAASLVLQKFPELKSDPESAPVVARVQWESRDRLAAIENLSAYVQAHPTVFAPHLQLVEWQSAAGMAEDAVRTARQSVAQFPKDFAPRALLIQALAAARTYESQACQQAIESYLKDFGGRAEALTLLAGVAGRHGWVGLARVLYVVGGDRQPNLGVLALYCSDALARVGRQSEAERVLKEIEAQTDDANVSFVRLLRERQVEVAARRGDHDGAREYARRLATALRGDPDAMEIARREFVQKGITEAVAELAAASGAGKIPGAR